MRLKLTRRHSLRRRVRARTVLYRLEIGENKARAMRHWIKSNLFLIGLAGVAILAWLEPDAGAQGGAFRSEFTRQAAVCLIFFVQGLALPTEDFRKGLGQMKLHGFVQGWNYLGFPLLALGLLALFGEALRPEIRFGFLYLAILPTTISSSVFFTAAAKGNVAGSVFNASVSNLLGVLLTPAAAALLLFSKVEGTTALAPMFWKLCRLIVLPTVVGQMLRPFACLPSVKPWFPKITTASIFFIMYCAFCDGVKNAAWAQLGWGAVGEALALALAALMLGAGLIWWSSGWLQFDRPSRMAAFFCASQKSLATGVPMAHSIFPAESIDGLPEISVIVLPLLCYHPLQLAMAAHLADRFRRSSASG